MFLLQLLQLLEQGIVFGVGDLGTVENVVKLFVPTNLFSQLLNLLCFRNFFHQAGTPADLT